MFKHASTGGNIFCIGLPTCTIVLSKLRINRAFLRASSYLLRKSRDRFHVLENKNKHLARNVSEAYANTTESISRIDVNILAIRLYERGKLSAWN